MPINSHIRPNSMRYRLEVVAYSILFWLVALIVIFAPIMVILCLLLGF